VFEWVMDIGAAWDAVIAGLERRGLWPTGPVEDRPRYDEDGDDPTPDSSASKV